MQEWYPDSHWHHHIHPDTEPAFVVRPGASCCPEPTEECVCVTEEDVDMWNKISALSGISDSALSNLSAFDKFATSAEKWNSNYNTVSSNSADWNETVYKINELSGIIDSSAYWENVADVVTNNSSFWDKAYNSIPAIINNTNDISALSSKFEKNIKTSYDSSLSGDGTPNSPKGVKFYNEYVSLINQLSAAIGPLYLSGEQNWLSLNATNDKNGINPYLKSLFSGVAVKDNDQDKTLIKHGELIEWLIKNRNQEGITYKPGYGIIMKDNTIAVSGYKNLVESAKNGQSAYELIKDTPITKFVKIKEPTNPSAIKNLTANNTIYYTV